VVVQFKVCEWNNALICFSFCDVDTDVIYDLMHLQILVQLGMCGGEAPFLSLTWKFTRKIPIPTSTKTTEPTKSALRKNAFKYCFTQIVL
jgi:hypothetical protein